MNEGNALAASESREVGKVAKRADLATRAEDVVIPRLRLLQNTSEEVSENKGKLGDIYNSQTSQVIGGFDKPVEIVPMLMYKTWRVMDVSGAQAAYVREEPVTADNQDRAWEGREDVLDRKTKQMKKACPVRYDFSYNFFVLLQADIAAEEAFPAVISFRRSSALAGKQLATHLFKRDALQQLPYSKTVILKVGKQKKDTNTYGVFEIHEGTKSSPEAHKAAEFWQPKLEGLIAKVAEEATVEGEGTAQAPVVMGAASGSDAAGPY